MATQFAVDLVFKSQTRQLNDIQRKLQQLEANLNKLNKGQPFKPIEDGAGRANVKVGGLVKTLGKLALAYGALKAGQAAISAGIDRIESERRIQFLAKSYGEAAQLAQVAANAAKRFGVSQTEANEALATTYARLRPVGVGLKDIESIYAGFSTAARISGASAQEAEGAFRQLAQGLGSGALRGDEFNSVAEQVPLILTAVSKETGIAQGKLRDYAAEGKITSDVVIRALKRIESEGASQLEDALDGPQQKIKDFQNASEDLAVAFSRELVPEMSGAIKELAQTLRDLIPILKAIGQVAAAVFKYIGGLARRINDMMNGAKMAQAELQADAQAQTQTRQKYGVLGSLSKEAQDYRSRVKAAQLAAARDALNPIPELSTAGTPDFGGGAPLPGGGGGGGKGGRSAADKAAKEAQRKTEQAAQQLKSARDLLFASENQLRVTQAQTEIDKIREGSAVKILEINKQYEELLAEAATAEETLALQLAEKNELKNEELSLEERLKDLRSGAVDGINEEIAALQAKLAGKEEEYRIQKRIADLVKSGGGSVSQEEATALVTQAEGLKKKAEAADQLKQQYEGLANSISGELTGAFRSIIDGSKSAEQALTDAFQGIANAFLDMAMQMIQEWLKMQLLGILTGGGGGMSSNGFFDPMTGKGVAGPNFGLADGGNVNAGGLHLVGERGPELFAPSSAGSVISHEQIFAATRQAMANSVNGSAATDAADDAFAANDAVLGQSASFLASKSSEARMQQSLNNSPVKVEVQTVRVGNMDVVSTEQFQAGMAATAKRARAQVFADLKNKPSARSAVGMR